MGLVDEILFEFRGQLSISDIYHMSYKELGYLREHRKALLSDPRIQKAQAAASLAGL